jgi:hypothetical protein
MRTTSKNKSFSFLISLEEGGRESSCVILRSLSDVIQLTVDILIQELAYLLRFSPGLENLDWKPHFPGAFRTRIEVKVNPDLILGVPADILSQKQEKQDSRGDAG